MSGICWFEEITVGDIDIVGGKGANLGEMARAGFPVPPGFCVVAPAYREMIEESGLYPKIEAILGQMDFDDPADAEDKSAQIRNLILGQPLSASLADEITGGYRQLGTRMGLADPNSTPVAVRSSATAEDLPTASFAGQQDTYLNVRGPEELLDHVRRCWASLWTHRAINYRVENDFDHQKVFISVVVQAMINSEVSGILFTANPVTSNREEVLINASWGLGEAIVSGQVNPDTLIVRKEDGQVVSRHTGVKELQIIYSADGGTVEVGTPDDLRLKPTLSDSQAAELAALGAKIEAHYDRPMDIEWGLVDGKLYLLQARPITTLVKPDTVHDVEGEYSRVMMVEIFPDALSPTFLSVVEPLLKGMFDYTFWRLGFKAPEGIEASHTFHHQPYFHRRYLEEAFSSLSPAVRKSMVEQFINPISHEEAESSHELSFAYVNMLVRMLRFMVLFSKRLPGILERYHAEIDEVNGLDLENATDEEVVTRIRGLVFDTISRLMNYDFLLIAMTGRTYELLENVLAPHYGQESEATVARLVSGLSGNATMETNMHLWDLAQEAKRSGEVSQIIRTCDVQEALKRLEASAGGRAFLQNLDHFMQGYGHREIRLDIIYPTWKEDPTPVFSFLRSYLDADEKQSPYAQQERLEQERMALTRQAETRIGQGLKGRLIMGRLFRWLLGQAQMCTRERDTMHFEWTRLFPPARRMFLSMGQRWRDRGLLDEPDDVFYLRFEEMESMVTAPISCKEIVQARKAEFEAARSYPWPDIIRDGQEIYLERGNGAPVSDDYLSGVAGSPGTVNGTARVVNGPEDFHKLQKGEILVAPLTNPVWTPLFAVAGGLVTEVGGILSHGAIVAREYGIPAVMSVNGATTKIGDGQTITVNGNMGTVYFGN
jgi:phosphohistidine swiveling domain-containing protein